MGKLRVSLFALLAACGSDAAKQADGPPAQTDAPKQIDAKIFNDAPPPTYDFTCLNNAAPTQADATITISGTVQTVSLQGAAGLADAAMTSCKAGAADCANANQYATATTAADGSFSVGPITTNGTPIDTYVTMTKASYRSAIVFDAGPMSKSQTSVPVLTFTNADFATLNQAASLGQTAGHGTFILYVTDCKDVAIADSANVTLSIKQGGTDVAGTKTFDGSMLNAMAAGSFLITNVPAGDTDIGATYKGMTLRTHTIKSVADTDSESVIRPGY